MTRHLLKSPTEAELAAAVKSFDRPNSSATPADMYTVLLRMPLQDVFWCVMAAVACWTAAFWLPAAPACRCNLHASDVYAVVTAPTFLLHGC
jgi:hypothetical protein